MIVITGARAGALNGATAEHVLARVPADGVVLVVRDPARAQHFADRGVELRVGDYAHADGLTAAFDGADQLLLVSSNDPGADAVSLHRNAITAATQASVGRVLYTSHQGASAATPFAPGRDHAATEDLLAASGLAWTSLRNGFYAHSLDWLLGPWRETGTVAVPADGPVSWTCRDDAAEAAALLLTSPIPHDGPVTLTASQALTFEQVAEVASEVTGRHIERVLVDPEQWVAEQIAAGRPEFVARFTLGMYQAAQGGFFAGTDPLLAKLLGREPRTVHDAVTAPAGH